MTDREYTRTYWAVKNRGQSRAAENVAAEVTATEDISYRDLQAKAKELDIPANQSADDLKAAIEDAGAPAEVETE